MRRDTAGGESGIRTRDTLADIPVFETGAFNHSATSPRGTAINYNPSPVMPAICPSLSFHPSHLSRPSRQASSPP